MTEKPILFSGQMVRAILEGRKTQTRRIAKEFDGKDVDAIIRRFPNQQGCPYGQPGDRLWVRETVWIPRPRTRHDMLEVADTWPKCIYSADTDAIEIEWMKEHRWKQRPSIHMPRWASRITLEVTRDEAKKLLPVIQAFAEGKEIEARINNGAWGEAPGPNFDPMWEWRIKRDPLECWVIRDGMGDFCDLFIKENKAKEFLDRQQVKGMFRPYTIHHMREVIE